MNEEFKRQVLEQLVEAGTAALTRFAQKRIEDAREIVGVPVQRIAYTVIRSQPGESPRRDTGVLQDSFQATEAYHLGDIIDIFIFTDDIKANWLDKGTEYMDERPFWEKFLTRIVEKQDELQALFAEELKANNPVGV